MATYRINKQLHNKIYSQNDQFQKELIKVNNKSFNKKNSELRYGVACCLYFKLVGRPYSKTDHKVIEIVDHQLNDKIIDSIKDDWQNQPIVKRMNITSFDELLEVMKLGILYTNTFYDLDEYHNKKQVE